MLILVGAGALLGGGLIGLIIGRAGPAAQQREELRRELDSARNELSRYKEEVNTHFSRTAELVNSLTESYRDVHQHLAASAEQLCDGVQPLHRLQQPLQDAISDQQTVTDAAAEQVPATDEAATGEAATGEAVTDKTATGEATTGEESSVEAPKDYALKSDPKAEGTLSESFGLHAKQQADPEHDPSKTADHAKP